MAAPPLISTHWFPPDERTTATSINQAANALGNGLSMLMGPALVSIPSDCNLDTILTNTSTSSSECPSKKDIRRDIDDYMYIQAAIAIIIFTLFCAYFPSKPPLPPAPSSAIQRTEFWTGVKQIIRNKSALLLCFAYSMGVSPLNHYSSNFCLLMFHTDSVHIKIKNYQNIYIVIENLTY